MKNSSLFVIPQEETLSFRYIANNIIQITM